MAAAEEFQVKIVCPGRDPIDKVVYRASTWAKDGFLEIYPDHAPIAYALGEGVCTLYEHGTETTMAIFGGIAHCYKNVLEIFTPYIEYPEEIDVDRAREALHRTRVRIQGKDPDVPKNKLESKRAFAARERAKLRLSLKGIQVDE